MRPDGKSLAGSFSRAAVTLKVLLRLDGEELIKLTTHQLADQSLEEGGHGGFQIHAHT